MKIRPIDDQVLVRRIPALGALTVGRSIAFGEIVALGAGAWESGKYKPWDMHVGQIVAFENHPLVEMNDGSDQYAIVSDAFVVAIVEE